MKWAILSDVHGNLEAFQAVIDSLSRAKIDKVIFLGDIVGYGASPRECIEVLRNLTDCLVAGNHDWGAVNLTSTFLFNLIAKEAILWTQEQLFQSQHLFLKNLPLVGREDNFTFVHATPYLPAEWNYLTSGWDVSANFDFFDEQICFIGHSHIPVVYIKDSGLLFSSDEKITYLQDEFRYMINVGSIGQPRDGNPMASYGIYDSLEKKFSLKRVPYNIYLAQKKIIDAGLPPSLAKRLGEGW